MIFNGHNFRRNKNLVLLPISDDEGNPMPYVVKGKENYCYFGKITQAWVPGAIRTAYHWEDETPVFALPLPLKGHSLTNLAYGQLRQLYLCHDGLCYQAKLPKRS